MSSLAERMRAAADTLEEWSARSGYDYPADIEWNAGQLRNEAKHVEDEDNAVERMAIDLRTADPRVVPSLRLDGVENPNTAWAELDEAVKVIYRHQAAQLVEMGYTK